MQVCSAHMAQVIVVLHVTEGPALLSRYATDSREVHPPRGAITDLPSARLFRRGGIRSSVGKKKHCVVHGTIRFRRVTCTQPRRNRPCIAHIKSAERVGPRTTHRLLAPMTFEALFAIYLTAPSQLVYVNNNLKRI